MQEAAQAVFPGSALPVWAKGCSDVLAKQSQELSSYFMQRKVTIALANWIEITA